jgi:hypothetical protein
MPLMPLHAALRHFFVAEGRGIIEQLEQSYATILSGRRASPGGNRCRPRVRRSPGDQPARKRGK